MGSSDAEIRQIILNKLNQIENQQDKQNETLRHIAERLTRVEEKVDALEERIKQDASAISELESLKNRGIGIKAFVGGVIAAIPGVLALLKLFVG